MFEDGDFDIPSVYMTDEEGDRFAAFAGTEVCLRSRARRIPATAFSVAARRGDPSRRIVLMAHIDAKIGTPGALDNATGVALLLLLAEMLAESDSGLGIELVPVNGEDYYASSGEKQWLTTNAGRLGEIVLGINMDGLGHRGGLSAFSLYGCPPDVERAIREVFAAHPGIAEGQPWYQGDHSMLLQNGVPALALTSEEMSSLWQEVAHTANDTPDLVDPAKLAEVAVALRELILQLDRQSRNP